MRRFGLTLILLCAAPATLIWAIAHGSAPLGWGEVLAGLAGTGDSVTIAIVQGLRLPRALSAFAVGGLLALSGALLQVLLRNPLADPYVLGISGGAAVAALLAMLAGFTGAAIGGAAFIGALTTILIVFGLSRIGGADSPSRLLLTGIVMAGGFGALVSLLLTLAPSTRVQGMLFHLMGDLSYADAPGLAFVVLAVGMAVSWWLATALNVFARGERVAAALGEKPARLRGVIYFTASLMTAAAVMTAGAVGFVGLIVPHMVRRMGGTDHRLLLPQTVLAGGSLLTAADVLARTVAAPLQLPVGVLTALIGVPAFLYLLTRTR